ncbi:glutamate ABC transporter substrate-binding protein [Kitasatospora sp. NPDC058965]|uniref:glutamate ABC transporter substrate-binding protein n=1 Tax=Kitasatospora sp. NPDC058965 TaxID=3346682 RepID=UPI0036B3F711
MTSRTALSVPALLLTLTVAAGLTACSSSGSKLPAPPGSTATGDGYQQVIDDAPVAADADIPAGSLMAQIKAHGTLNVGGTDSAALFALKDPVSGKVTGFDAGLAEMLAKYIIGRPSTKRVQIDVSTREVLLQNGTVDTVIATYTITPARAQKIAFAGPYYSSGDAILVKASDTSISKASDLNGKSVCTETNSTAANDIKQYAPSAQVVLFQTNAECQQAVEQGRAQAYVLDQALLLGDAARDKNVKVVGQPFTEEPYGIGVPQSSPAMKTFVNNWLKLIEQDGEWAKLWKATIGTELSGDAPTPPVIGSAAGS